VARFSENGRAPARGLMVCAAKHASPFARTKYGFESLLVLRAVFVCEGNISDRLWIKAYCMRKKPVKKRIIVLSMATALFLGIVFVFF